MFAHRGESYGKPEEDEVSGKTLAIVGGGAAGLITAAAAGERALEMGEQLDIAIFERDERVGRPILATGNGRCNFSNNALELGAYRNASFVESVFDSLAASFESSESDSYMRLRNEAGDDVHAFFRRHGLAWRVEGEGREYPLPNKASVVVDILRDAVKRVGARECCGCSVDAVESPRNAGGRFTLRLSDGVFERADAVIVACGGRAIPGIDVAGLHATGMRPVLGPLRVADSDIPFARELDNIRVRCLVTLKRPTGTGNVQILAEERGEVMFRKYGVSGIAVFNLSRYVRPGDILSIDLIDAGGLDEAERVLFARRKLIAGSLHGPLAFGDMMRGLVLPRVSEALLKRSGLSEHARFEKGDVPALAAMLTRLELTVAGIGDESICQVRRGGFSVSAFDPATMCVHGQDGLYAAGEAIDVDGPCGGYNLHWAWASGLLAGRSAAEMLLGETASSKE